MQNFSQTPNQDIRQTLDSSQEILILMGRNPSFDSVSAGLSLYLAFSSIGKRVSISCPTPMTVEFNRLIGVDKVTQNLSNGGRNLVVSFPYVEGSIEKVSYNIENDVFNLVIEPREGYPTITQDKLAYSFGGGTFDCIFTVGVSSLDQVGALYDQNQALFSQKPVVNIDINPSNGRFGKINAVEQNFSSVSELVTNLLNTWNLRFDADTATNLLAGITFATNNFMSPTSGVSAFETAAILMRSGARRQDVPAQQTQAQAPAQPYQFPTPFPQQNPMGPATQNLNTNAFPQTYQENQNAPQPSLSQPSYPQPLQQPVRPQNFPSQPKVQPQRPMTPPAQQNTNFRPQQQPPQQKKQETTPPDWLKPKIYKGSTLL